MTEHTPGPWFIEWAEPKEFPGDVSINDAPQTHSDRNSIALVYADGLGTERANARLIASAPDLLDALQELTDAADERFAYDDPYRPILDQALVTIDGALGGAS